MHLILQESGLKKVCLQRYCIYRKNDGPRFSPYDSFQYGFNSKMLKPAQEASNGDNNLDALALRFYTLVPDRRFFSELEDRKSFERSDAAKAKVQEKIDQLEATIRGGTSVDIQGLRLLAFIYEKNNNFRGAYSIYDYLSQAFPNAKLRRQKESSPRNCISGH